MMSRFTLISLFLFPFLAFGQTYNHSLGMHLKLYVKNNNILKDLNNIQVSRNDLVEVYYKITFVNASDTIIAVDSFPQISSEFYKEGYYFVVTDSSELYESQRMIPIPVCWQNQKFLEQSASQHGKVYLKPKQFYTMPKAIKTNYFSTIPSAGYISVRYRTHLPNGKGYYMQESDNTVFINLH